MRKLRIALVAAAVAAAVGLPQAALAADGSRAMSRHMGLMAADNPGMMRMMQTPMAHMENAPPFQMP